MKPDAQIRYSILANLDRRMDARCKAPFDSLNRLTHAECAALRAHRRKRLAARLGALQGVLMLAVAFGCLLACAHSPCRVITAICSLLWGIWGFHFLRTRH